jgi:flagellar basal-body rod modification protein FlgD
MSTGTNQTTSLASTSAATGAKTTTKKAGIADNFDSFLLLLTTQLKNQTPLDPLNTNEFTQQLVQFASVEQQIKSNTTLEALLTGAKTSTAANAASFVGMQATADGTTSRLSGGKAGWTMNAARDAAQAVISVKDVSGSVIFNRTQTLKSGSQSFEWNGRTSSGTIAPDGDYTLQITARDAAGQAVSVKTEIAGRVDSVDLTQEPPVLTIGNAQVPLTSIKSLRGTPL